MRHCLSYSSRRAFSNAAAWWAGKSTAEVKTTLGIRGHAQFVAIGAVRLGTVFVDAAGDDPQVAVQRGEGRVECHLVQRGLRLDQQICDARIGYGVQRHRVTG